MLSKLMVLIGCIAITSCSSSSDNNAGGSGISSYFAQSGDVITFNDHFNATYSNGQHASQDSVTKEYYGQVNSIPSKYAYTGDITSPYQLCITTDDDQIDGFEYSSMQDDVIVDDDMETFKRIDAQTKTGSTEPENVDVVNVGDMFTYYENSTLFDSTSAQETGNTVQSGTFTVVSQETMSVPAGTYDAFKIDFTMNITTTLPDNSSTSDFTGSAWFDTANGLPLKLVGTVNMTFNETGITATGESQRVLASYQSSANTANLQSTVQAVQTINTRSDLTRAFVVQQIIQTQFGAQAK